MARMQMTPMVRFAMYFLRIYLIFMLIVIVYGFIRQSSSGQNSGKAPTTAPASQKS